MGEKEIERDIETREIECEGVRKRSPRETRSHVRVWGARALELLSKVA